jgi:hypothetical protein
MLRVLSDFETFSGGMSVFFSCLSVCCACVGFVAAVSATSEQQANTLAVVVYYFVKASHQHYTHAFVSSVLGLFSSLSSSVCIACVANKNYFRNEKTRT